MGLPAFGCVLVPVVIGEKFCYNPESVRCVTSFLAIKCLLNNTEMDVSKCLVTCQHMGNVGTNNVAVACDVCLGLLE